MKAAPNEPPRKPALVEKQVVPPQAKLVGMKEVPCGEMAMPRWEALPPKSEPPRK